MKIIFQLIVIFLLTAAKPVFAEANAPRESVNVLTWWGYLDHPEIIKQVETQCNVALSFDQYYSNDEFLHRWEGHKEWYDVIIFSGTIYNLIKDKLPHIKNSSLWQHSKDYHPVIKSHYLGMHYPHNVVYFMHTMTGFLWNPDNITISDQDSIKAIFNKAANKYVVIMDDPVEAEKLLETEHISDFTIGKYKSTIQQANVYITNNYSKIYKKQAFAFSYGWSGEAVIDLIAANKNYQFLVHPKLSYISSDLLAQTSAKPGAACVATALTDEKMLVSLQNKYYYFIPYINYKNVKNVTFKKLYIVFTQILPRAAWVDQIDEDDFQQINKQWQLIKILLNNHSRREKNELNN